MIKFKGQIFDLFKRISRTYAIDLCSTLNNKPITDENNNVIGHIYYVDLENGAYYGVLYNNIACGSLNVDKNEIVSLSIIGGSYGKI